MKKALVILPALLLASPAYALHLKIKGIKNEGKIPDQFAFCVKDGLGKTKNGSNLNPQVRWSNPPAGTKSYAFIVVDTDVPVDFEDANQEGKMIVVDAPRRDFYHWVLVDIPAKVNGVDEGDNSDGHEEGGKSVGRTSYGFNGQNDFASVMKGSFGGYDGPCPPWNDARIHHYHFRAYALDVPNLRLPDNFTGKQVEAAIAKHTLAMAEVVATYSNKP